MNRFFLFLLIAIGLLFSGCSRKSKYYYAPQNTSKPTSYSSSSSAYNTSISQKEYRFAKMKPYIVRNIKYYPQNVNVGDTFDGIASWYGPSFHAKLTANGETYNMYDMTAAHKTLPMNTMLLVTNRKNGLSAVVRINDRGPFIGTRIIDLSNAAARKIDMVRDGTASVTIEVLGFYSKDRKRGAQTKAPVAKSKIVQVKAASSTKIYALQIASFTNIEGALKVQEDYNNTDGYTTVIKDIEAESGRFFKVYLKGFKTEDEARRYKANGNFVNSFIVEYK